MAPAPLTTVTLTCLLIYLSLNAAVCTQVGSDVQNTLKKYFEITKIKYSYKVF